MFSGVDKGGTWTPARQVPAVTMFGGADLDFREANLAPGVTELRIRCLFGGMAILALIALWWLWVILTVVAVTLGLPMLNLASFQVFADSPRKYSARVVKLVERSLVIDMLAPPAVE